MTRPLTFALAMFITGALMHAQETPAHSRAVPTRQGWECLVGYVERGRGCIGVAVATDTELRRYLVGVSASTYVGSCRCPEDTDRAGRRCGGRSAWSRPGGAAPLCYPGDISAVMLRDLRDRHPPTP